MRYVMSRVTTQRQGHNLLRIVHRRAQSGDRHLIHFQTCECEANLGSSTLSNRAPGQAAIRDLKFSELSEAILRARQRPLFENSGRRGVNVAVTALANKMARVAWAMLRHGTVYEPNRLAA